MIINNNIQALTSIYSTTAAAGSKRAGYAQQATARDEILLSREAQSFSGMIESGNYSVSAENIAASMLGTRF